MVYLYYPIYLRSILRFPLASGTRRMLQIFLHYFQYISVSTIFMILSVKARYEIQVEIATFPFIIQIHYTICIGIHLKYLYLYTVNIFSLKLLIHWKLIYFDRKWQMHLLLLSWSLILIAWYTQRWTQLFNCAVISRPLYGFFITPYFQHVLYWKTW